MDEEQFRVLEKRLHDLQDDAETNKELQALDKIALLGAGGGTIASATVLSGLLARAPQSVLPWPMVADFTIFVVALGLSFWVQTLKVRLARTAHVHRRQDPTSKQPEVVSKRKRAVQLAIASYEKRVRLLWASLASSAAGILLGLGFLWYRAFCV